MKTTTITIESAGSSSSVSHHHSSGADSVSILRRCPVLISNTVATVGYALLVVFGYRQFLQAVAMSALGSKFDSQMAHTVISVAATAAATLVALRFIHVTPAFARIGSVIRGAMVVFPPVLPFLVSYSVYANRNDPTRQHNQLSNDINLILFTLITAACYAGFAVLYAIRTRLKQSCAVCIPLAILFVGYSYYSAQSAYTDWSRGLHGRTLRNHVPPDRAGGGGGDWDFSPVWSSGDSSADISVGDSYGLGDHSTCIIPPHLHLASILPRRLTNGFAGPEQCPAAHVQYSAVDREGWLDLHCNQRGGPLITLNPDWVTGRAKDVDALSRMRDAAPPQHSFRFDDHPIRVGGMAEYLTVLCHAKEDFHIIHAPRQGRIASWQARSAQPHKPTLLEPVEPVKPNVLITFIDALSRAHFHRRLTKTVETLERLHAESASERQRIRERAAAMERAAAGRTDEADSGGDDESDVTGTGAAASSTGSNSEAGSSTGTGSGRGRRRIHPPTGYTVYEFFRYHILGSNTRPNVVPLFCGTFSHAVHERVGGCDPSDLVYRVLHDAGYVTGWLDNHCQDPIVDYFDKPGTYAPRHVHEPQLTKMRIEMQISRWRPAAATPLVEEFGSGVVGLDAHVVAPFCHPQYDAYGVWSNFAGPYALAQRCINGRHVHAYAFEYMTQYVDTYRTARVPYFGFAAFSEAHEGSLAVVSVLDNDLAAFVERHTHLPVQPKVVPTKPGAETKPAEPVSTDGERPTIHFLMSDHGNHMGPFWETPAGRIEHRLPALFMLVPNSLLAQYPALHTALHHNQDALCTAADLHQTIRHIASYPNRPTVAAALAPEWGRSLLEPIPLNRTCAAAGIPKEYCVCGMDTKI